MMKLLKILAMRRIRRNEKGAQINADKVRKAKAELLKTNDA